MLRVVLAILLAGMIGAAAVLSQPSRAQSSGQPAAGDTMETPEEAFASALRQAIGAPARADLGDQAEVRLSAGLLLVPKTAAARLLTATDHPVPPDFVAMVLGSEGFDAPGIIRFVPAGFINADEALAWTPEDMLSSLKDTVERANAPLIKQHLPEREARRWIEPPHYDPETHQLSWAALIIPKSEPRESDGEITYHALAFGREGYFELSVVTSVQKAGAAASMASAFLSGLTFRPGKAYPDAQTTDRRASGGLASAMDIDSLHKVASDAGFWATDTVVPVAGTIVAAIGGFGLLVYFRRQMRREARRR